MLAGSAIECYELNANVLLRAEPQYYESYIAFDFTTSRTTYLSAKEFAVAAVIARGAGTGQVSRDADALGIPASDTLARLASNGILVDAMPKMSPTDRSSSVFVPSASKLPIASFPVLSFPSRVDFTITRLCDMRCVHCNVSANRQWPTELTVEEWIKVFDQLEDNGALRVQISGGEATRHPEFAKLLRHLASKRYFKSLLTNAARLDEKQIATFAAARMTIGVSLDGASPESHDRFRKSRGSFRRVTTNLHVLRDYGVPTTLTCTLHALNVDEIPGVFQIASDAGVRILNFGFIDDIGRGHDNQEWVLPLSAMKEARETFYDMKKHYPHIEAFIEDPASLMGGSGERPKFANCKAGVYSMAFDCDGEAFSCTLGLQLRAEPKGNVREKTVREIWTTGDWSAFRGGISLDDLEACGSCSLNGKCTMKRCRMRSIQATGRLTGRPYKCPGKELEALAELSCNSLA